MSDISKLTNEELLKLEHDTIYNISKFNNFQMVKKIQLNSCYGYQGATFSRFYNKKIAEAITKTAKSATNNVIKYLNEYLNKKLETIGKDYIIAGDTDSCYVYLEPYLQMIEKKMNRTFSYDESYKLINRLCEEIFEKIIERASNDLMETLNYNEPTLKMKREVISDTAVFTDKKKYVMSVIDSEGVYYAEPKIKITGLDAVRNSYPKICREKLKQCYKKILYEPDSVKSFIDDFKKSYRNYPLEEIAQISTANNLNKYSECNVGEYYKLGCPNHIRGAIYYNLLLDELNLTNKYEKIFDGDKIKILHLLASPKINPAFTCIAFKEKLPPEFKLEKYIDFEKLFENTFYNSIEKVTNVANIKIEDSIFDMF